MAREDVPRLPPTHNPPSAAASPSSSRSSSTTLPSPPPSTPESEQIRAHGGIDTKLSSLRLSRAFAEGRGARSSNGVISSDGGGGPGVRGGGGGAAAGDPMATRLRAGMAQGPALAPFCWEPGSALDVENPRLGHPSCFDFSFATTAPRLARAT